MSLKDYVVALSGTWVGETHSEIGKAIEKAGGTYFTSSHLTDVLTHLVVSEEAWVKGKKTPKVNQAFALNKAKKEVKMVSIEWIHKSTASKKKVSESKYLMGKLDEEGEEDVEGEDEEEKQETGKKRGRPAKTNSAKMKKEDDAEGTEEADGEAKQETGEKRGRTTKAKSAKVKNKEDEEADEEPPAKKTKAKRSKVKKEEDEEADEEPPAKKTRAKRANVKKEEDEEADEEPPAKKTKAKRANVKKEDKDADEEPPAKGTKTAEDGQYWKGGMVIPVDEEWSVGSNWEVYVDDDNLIWDATLNQTDSGGNNNKFYRIQLLTQSGGSQFYAWTHWGRIGESGQNALLGDTSLDDAKKQFEKKFKDKSGNKWADRSAGAKNKKYTFIEKDYFEDSPKDEEEGGKKSRRGSGDAAAKAPESTLTLPVQQLMTLIFNTENFANAMKALNYDAQKLPLGKLSKKTLERGYDALKKLAEVIADPDLAQKLYDQAPKDAIERWSNQYYTLIPHAFGRNRPPVISDDTSLKKEIELLESLSDMEIANKLMQDAKADVTDMVHPLDRQYQGLGMAEMTDLDPKSSEFQQLREYLVQSTGATHHVQYKVEAIFRIERSGELDRFGKSPYGKVKSGDRRLLWHGSRATNFGGILSQGLRIAPPEAPVSGYMFGKGIYLADISSKSAGYTASYSSGGIGLLLLCEAELGKPMLELTNADYNAGDVAKKQGSFSTWGKGTTAPQGWKDASCVNENLKGISMPDMSKPPGRSNINGAGLLYNEYICYDVAQIRLRYLFRVKM